MKRSLQLHRASICHDVHADPSDALNYDWHKGWSLPGSEATAFYFKAQWWVSVPGRATVTGPFKSRDEALVG